MRTNNALIERYLAHQQVLRRRPDTIQSYRYILGQLSRRLAVPLLEASPDDLREWHTDVLTPLATNTARARIACVKGFYRWARKNRLLEVDPAEDLVSPRRSLGTPRPISEDDLAFAMRTAPEPERTWMATAGYAGLRGGEISRLRRDSLIQHGRRYELLVDGKGGRQRVVACPTPLAEMLRPYVLRSRGWLFADADGRRIRPETLRGRVNRFLHRMGIPHTLHTLRHRFGTEFYAVSNDIVATQHALGHSSAATTAIYVGSDASKAAAASERLAKRLTPRRTA